MKENIYECLTAILMQELFENGLFDIDEISKKYTMDEETETVLKELYKEYYGED